MSNRRFRAGVGLFLCVAAILAQAGLAQAGIIRAVEPVTFTVRFPSPSNHLAEVQAVYPTEGQRAIQLMMPTWTPGFYRVENYAGKIQEFSARTVSGADLPVDQPKTNRWRVQTRG